MNGAQRKRIGDGLYQRGDAFQAAVYDRRAGKRIWKTFGTKSAAKHWRRDAQVAIERGDLSADRGPLLRDYSAVWLEDAGADHARNRSGDSFKPAALRAYEASMRLRVLPALGDFRLREITTRDVQRFVDDLVREGHAPATVDGSLTPLRTLFRRAVARGDAVTNPTRGVEKPAVRCAIKRVASPSEAARLLDALAVENRALWATAFYAGLRRGELIALRPEDLDLASGSLRVEHGWDAVEGEIAPKSREGRRTVPIPAVLRDHLVEHVMRRDGAERVFGSPGHVRGAIERARKQWSAASLEPMPLHGCRHTYASFMIAAGVNAKALSTFMGHANIAITLDLYGHLMPGSEIEAAGLLDAYLARAAGGSTVAQTVAEGAESQC